MGARVRDKCVIIMRFPVISRSCMKPEALARGDGVATAALDLAARAAAVLTTAAPRAWDALLTVHQAGARL